MRRFVKYRLGEGLEKKSNDFAAEVAQQTQAKAAAPAQPKEDKPKAEEPKKVGAGAKGRRGLCSAALCRSGLVRQ